MKHKILKITIIILTIIFGFNLLTLPTYAEDSICAKSHGPGQEIPEEVWKAAGCEQNASDQLPTTITNILYTIIGIAGLVAVVFVIIGGVNYMTSSGDAGKLEKAKKTILYACIGLIICALAFAIVNWVIGGVLKQGATTNEDNKDDKSKKSYIIDKTTALNYPSI